MQTKYSTKDIERFWGYIDKENSQTFYNGSRCWEWTGAKTGKGYGGIKINGAMRLTHRLAYEITNGEIPNDLQVLHHCDNRSCCNPEHFFLGTNQDNIDDKVLKSRQPNGETHGMHKLTAEQVLEIRRRYKPFGIGGENTYQLAKVFGISRRQIGRILKNESW